MRGIERVVAALLLAGAVASAVALPRFAAGPDSAVSVAGGALPHVTTIVEAAPLPAPKPKPKLVRVAIQSIARSQAATPATPHRSAVPPQRIQRAPHVAPVAPDVVQTPAPVPTPAPTPSPTVQVATPSAPTVSPTPVLPSLGLGQGKGQGKGHDKGDNGATPIVLPQVQPAPAPADNGNGNGKGHGHDKGA